MGGFMEVVVGRSIGQGIVRIDRLFCTQEIETHRFDRNVVLRKKQARCPSVIERRGQPFACGGNRLAMFIRDSIQCIDDKKERLATKVLMSHEINEWIV